MSGVASLAVPLDRLTVPKLLQQANYTTGVVGKWHLGLGETEPDFNAELRPGRPQQEPAACGTHRGLAAATVGAFPRCTTG